jgi:hypothetical protein
VTSSLMVSQGTNSTETDLQQAVSGSSCVRSTSATSSKEKIHPDNVGLVTQLPHRRIPRILLELWQSSRQFHRKHQLPNTIKTAST